MADGRILFFYASIFSKTILQSLLPAKNNLVESFVWQSFVCCPAKN